jgi:membrane protease subunit HflK
MPWNNDGGNGGSWKPGKPGPWEQKPQAPEPNFDDLLRRGQDWVRQTLSRRGSGGGSGGGIGGYSGRLIFALVLVAIGLWLLSGFYTVDPNEVGLNKIFGRYTGKTGPGLNYNLPYPIGAVQKLQVTDRNAINIGFISRTDSRTPNSHVLTDLPEESLMLTGDENIADVKFVVFWQIDPSRPEDYAFNIANQRETVKAVAESAMREVIGRSEIQNILTAERKVIEPAVQQQMQKTLNEYKAGVLVLQVQLQSVDPPEQVIAAFRDVTAAQQDQDRLRNEAQAYANRVVPEARGKAAAIVQEAEGYRLQTVAEATGQASRFDQVYEQYKKAPDVTRERIYLETMEHVFGGTDKIIVDSESQGVVPYLPLGALTGGHK